MNSKDLARVALSAAVAAGFGLGSHSRRPSTSLLASPLCSHRSNTPGILPLRATTSNADGSAGMHGLFSDGSLAVWRSPSGALRVERLDPDARTGLARRAQPVSVMDLVGSGGDPERLGAWLGPAIAEGVVRFVDPVPRLD